MSRLGIERLLEVEDREDRLPAWAREKLRMLRMRLDEAEDRWEKFRADAAGGAPYSDTAIGHDFQIPGLSSHQIKLPSGTPIVFDLDGDQIEARVQRVGLRPELVIGSPGGRPIAVRPLVTNSIIVEHVKR